MPPTNEILSIDTPENVTFDYDVAGIGSRFLAALIDTTILITLQVIVLGTALVILSRTDALDDAEPYLVVAVLSLISFIFLWGYYIFFEILWNGQTPGKRWVGLRVIRVDGTPETASEAVIRNLVRTVDILPAGYGVGVVAMFINPQSRRLGDLAAGTLVVHDSKTTRLADLRLERRESLATLTTNSALPAGFPVERLDADQIELIEDFLTRRYSLANRAELANHILKSLAERLGQPVDLTPGDTSESMLIAIHKELTKRDAA